MSSARFALRAGALSVLAASALMTAGGAAAAEQPAAPTTIAPSAPAGDVASTSAQTATLAREDAELARPDGGLTIQATTGRHTLCHIASVRAANKTNVLGYAQAGDKMDVDHYATHTNPQGGHSLWAYGVAHTQAGAITGYVLYEDGTFC